MEDLKSTTVKPGLYWVKFKWGWEPARFDGDEWLRFGIEKGGWNVDVVEVGEGVKRDDPTDPPQHPDTKRLNYIINEMNTTEDEET